MQELVLDKAQDEARQGEAFAPVDISLQKFEKHFYIESYGCPIASCL